MSTYQAARNWNWFLWQTSYCRNRVSQPPHWRVFHHWTYIFTQMESIGESIIGICPVCSKAGLVLSVLIFDQRLIKVVHIICSLIGLYRRGKAHRKFALCAIEIVWDAFLSVWPLLEDEGSVLLQPARSVNPITQAKRRDKSFFMFVLLYMFFIAKPAFLKGRPLQAH